MSPFINEDQLEEVSNRTKSIRSQFFSNKFSQNDMKKKKEPSPDGQAAQYDKQLNTVKQSLNDLLNGDHSSDKDDVVDD